MKKIIASVALSLILTAICCAQTTEATTKTICKGASIPAGYTTVGEAQSSDCPNGAWVIKQRGTAKPKLELSAERAPRIAEEVPPGAAGPAREPASTHDAIAFAQRAFEMLSRGNVAVEEMIDWDNLKLEGKDFGAVLRQIATTTKKDMSTVRKEIITNFGSYYRASGDAFTTWKIDSRTADSTTVAATSAKGEVILFIISLKGGKQVVSAMNSRK